MSPLLSSESTKPAGPLCGSLMNTASKWGELASPISHVAPLASFHVAGAVPRATVVLNRIVLVCSQVADVLVMSAAPWGCGLQSVWFTYTHGSPSGSEADTDDGA